MIEKRCVAAAAAYLVEVMEAKGQAHHEDGEGAVVPPSVASRCCSEMRKKIAVYSDVAPEL